MNTKSSYFMLSIIFLFLNASMCTSSNHEENKMRKATATGSFYPADKQELAAMVDQFLSLAQIPEIKAPVIALISPHAGYVYSGHVAAHAYKLLKGRDIKRIVVISPSHVTQFSGASVYDGQSYETPLGVIEVDQAFVNQLTANGGRVFKSAKGHESLFQERGEHALEVQLPFLQRVLTSFKLAPIIMGDQSYETCRALGFALANLIKDEQTVIVASSDLSHFHSYEEAVNLDKKVLNAVQEWDYFNLSRNLSSQICEACGGGPIIAAMIAAERLGANIAQLMKYANSGDVPHGERSRVVGYSAFAFLKKDAAEMKADESFLLNKDEQDQLLKIARAAVEKMVNEGKTFEPSVAGLDKLKIDRGAFVTLKIKGNLRGCIGYTSPVMPLFETVRDMAIQAATRDPRFSPVSKAELSSLRYEISVLSPFRRVLDTAKIEVGKHGLLIKKGGYTGLLLPQVPVEQDWDRLTFLEQTCRKAGLPTDAWKDAETDIFQFTAFVFGED